MPCGLVNKALSFLIALVFSLQVQGDTRPPKVRPSISPQGYSDFQYNNHLSNDFRFTDRFEIEKPVSIRVRLHGVEAVEGGYAFLLFTYEDTSDIEFRSTADDGFYRATLQTTDEVRRLEIKKRDLEDGVEAVLTGWPATDAQRVYSDLLVEEISLSRNGKSYVLHRDSVEMVKFKNKDKPRKGDESSDQPPAGDGSQ